MRSLQELRAPIMARLNAALDRQPDAHLPWPTQLKEEPVPIEWEELGSLDPHAALSLEDECSPHGL